MKLPQTQLVHRKWARFQRQGSPLGRAGVAPLQATDCEDACDTAHAIGSEDHDECVDSCGGE